MCEKNRAKEQKQIYRKNMTDEKKTKNERLSKRIKKKYNR